jgi:hypothetical protein
VYKLGFQASTSQSSGINPEVSCPRSVTVDGFEPSAHKPVVGSGVDKSSHTKVDVGVADAEEDAEGVELLATGVVVVVTGTVAGVFTGDGAAPAIVDVDVCGVATAEISESPLWYRQVRRFILMIT